MVRNAKPFRLLLPAACLVLAGACTAAPASDPGASSAPSATAAAAGLQGEWSPDPSLCGESRLSFTADGRHEAWYRDGGDWQVLASGRYTREGDRLVISLDGVSQVREVVSVDAAQLRLRHDDAALAEALGSDTVTLHRCPPR